MTNAPLVFQAKLPPNGPERDIRVEPKEYDRWRLRYKTDFMNLLTCREVLLNPGKIFCDLRRPCSDSSDFLCVAGRPKTWFIRDKVTQAFPKDLVFLVFLNDRYSIYEFGAEELDGSDEFYPENYDWRFGEELKWTNS